MDFDKIYEDFSKLVFHLAMESIDDFYLAEDIVQDVFFKLSRSNIIFEGEDHLRAWFIRVTYTTCVDYSRRMELERRYIECLKVRTNSVNTINELHEYWDMLERIDSIFDKLWAKHPHWYYVCVEHYYNKKSNKEIAKQFDMTPDAVGMLLMRIRRWIGKALMKQNPKLKNQYVKFAERWSEEIEHFDLKRHRCI